MVLFKHFIVSGTNENGLRNVFIWLHTTTMKENCLALELIKIFTFGIQLSIHYEKFISKSLKARHDLVKLGTWMRRMQH